MSNSLHTMSLAAHVADFHRALRDTPSNDPREALTLLQGDPIAQIMSFVPPDEEQPGLHAVSPQMRLDSEAMMTEIYGTRSPEARVDVIKEPHTLSDVGAEGVLCFCFTGDGEESDRQQMMLSLWWASRCGLPVDLSIYSDDREMLEHFDDVLRSRVRALTVTMRSLPVRAADDAVVPNSPSDTTVLVSLLSFSNLQSLSIRNDEQQADAPVPAEVLNVLETAAGLPLTTLSVAGFEALHNLSALAGSRSLRSLTVAECGLRSLKGIGSFPILETLTISDCPQLTSRMNLVGLSRLQVVRILRCDLRSLKGLDCCAALKCVIVQGNVNLQSLSPLAGAPRLEMIDAWDCDIRSVQGLGSCAALTKIRLDGNQHLQCLGDLSKAPCLQKVNATNCDLQDLGETGPWFALREIHVGGNENLQSLSGLAGAPLLQIIDANDCGIRSVQGLGSCAALTRITLDCSENLQSLSDLSKAPSLQKVEARHCGLRDLGETGLWFTLQDIDVGNNIDLQSLSGLAGAPLLQEVCAVGCSIQDFTVLETCPMLRNVTTSENYFLR